MTSNPDLLNIITDLKRACLAKVSNRPSVFIENLRQNYQSFINIDPNIAKYLTPETLNGSADDLLLASVRLQNYLLQ